MRIQFKEIYFSIENFNPVDISNFTVLTGINGSGKSHLLRAIKERKVVFTDITNPNIVLFNYETFKLDNESSFNLQQISNEREQAWHYHIQNIQPQVQKFLRNIDSQKYEEIKSSCKENKKNFLEVRTDSINAYITNIKNLFTNDNSYKSNSYAQGIYSLAKKIPYSIDEIEHDDFIQQYTPFSLKDDFLPRQLGKVFADYAEKLEDNIYKSFRNQAHNEENRVLKDEDFIKIHGEKPWNLVNRILETFDTMQYRVNSPESLNRNVSYQIKLIHTKNNKLIDFDSLSSGERVLMALIASIYKKSSDRIFPDVLLLDEVDASLHPSMIKNMLEVIEEIFIAQGAKVILVSHSPTTIALSPEDSIYIMNKSGMNRIEKKTKSEALSILTEGFATLEDGLKLFDEVTQNPITIITEGKNALFIKKALELDKVNGVEVLCDIDTNSGKNQLKTLFEFFLKIPHNNKVIFVWDCDVSFKPSDKFNENNNTYPYVMPKNEENQIAKKGIENAFPNSLFANFTKKTERANGEIIQEFDEATKNKFLNFIIDRNKKTDFEKFKPLIVEINRIKNT